MSTYVHNTNKLKWIIKGSYSTAAELYTLHLQPPNLHHCIQSVDRRIGMNVRLSAQGDEYYKK